MRAVTRVRHGGFDQPQKETRESGCAGVAGLSEDVEYFVAAVDFHLVNHREKDSETAFWIAALVEKPAQIFRGKLVDREAVRGIVCWPVLSKRNPCAADFLKISEHLFLKTFHERKVNVGIVRVVER